MAQEQVSEGRFVVASAATMAAAMPRGKRFAAKRYDAITRGNAGVGREGEGRKWMEMGVPKSWGYPKILQHYTIRVLKPMVFHPQMVSWRITKRIDLAFRR